MVRPAAPPELLGAVTRVMAIRGWDPLGDILSLQESMNRLLEEALAPVRLSAPLEASPGWTPAADVYETGDSYVVLIELPGIDEDDVEMAVDGDRLVVKGERRARLPAKPDRFHRMERSHGPFARTFALPQAVEPDQVAAQFRDGLLRIELAKARVRAPRSRGERAE
jgi:HSP20 family protein